MTYMGVNFKRATEQITSSLKQVQTLEAQRWLLRFKSGYIRQLIPQWKFQARKRKAIRRVKFELSGISEITRQSHETARFMGKCYPSRKFHP